MPLCVFTIHSVNLYTYFVLDFSFLYCFGICHVGEGVILRHVRNGVEMPPIDKNLFYDFNFQLTNHVTPRTVLPVSNVVCMYTCR